MSIFFLKQPSVLPGFKITMGFTLFYLGLIVVIPLSGLFFKTATLNLDELWKAIANERVISAYRVSFSMAFIAALTNTLFGVVVAWVLVRYQFWGKRLVDAMVDLPFALPTAVAGIALSSLYAPEGWLGRWFEAIGVQVAYTPAGIAIALIFVGLPFVVRTVEPVLQELDKEIEEAAKSLGATRMQTFRRIILPHITPALLTGFAMAFARGLGEYGSVIFIAGNMPMVSEVVPLMIIIKLEQYDYAGATAIAIVMLIISFVLLFCINVLQNWSGNRMVHS